MRKQWVKIAFALVLVFLPFLIRWAYQTITSLPAEIVIGTGPVGGKYEPLMRSLAKKIETKLHVKVRTPRTRGSVDNRLLLQAGKADFGPYQAGALETMERLDPSSMKEIQSRLRNDFGINDFNKEPIAVVANLYSAPVSFIVRRDAGIESPADLPGKSVRIGVPGSGDHAMGLLLLEHFGLEKKSIRPIYLEYPEVKEAFLKGALDAAFITFSAQAPVFPDIFQTGKVALLSIPNAEAFVAKHLSLSQYRIPAGLYRSRYPVSPPTDIQTVAINIQLMARAGTHTGLVEEVTKIVLSEEFQKENQMQELFLRGRVFAQERPEFAIHAGAVRIYNPQPNLLLNPDFAELVQKWWSFVFSLITASILSVRWLKRRKLKTKVGKLDRYIQSLLDIERRQSSLAAGSNGNEIEELHKFLDEVTALRQEALRDFTVHELIEDRAADCFLEMCHGLSNKIGDEISRRELNKQFGELGKALNPTAPPVSQ